MNNPVQTCPMTDEQIRIAVAEACGWEHHRNVDGDGDTWTSPDGHLHYSPPNYLIDLNATARMEESLEPYSEEYAQSLYDVVKHYWDAQGKRVESFTELGWFYAVAHATARQRCEAFLRTKGLWLEPKP